MPTVLHILTRPNDELATFIVSHQQRDEAISVRTFDGTHPAPDYNQLLEQIFEADSIQVW